MRLPRFHCPVISSPRAVLDEAESRHAVQSLRLGAGDAVELFDGHGARARGRIEEEPSAEPRGRKSRKAAARGVGVRIEQLEVMTQPERTLTLVVAGCKGPRLDWLVEKCTELGVSKLVFARFERSVVVPGASHVEKLLRSAIEACKQCGRDWQPEFTTEVGLAEAVTTATTVALGSSVTEHRVGASAAPPSLLVAHPAAAEPITSVLARCESAGTRQLTGVIGPEGGLTDAELKWLQSVGAALVRLGPHVLRVETAAVGLAAHWAAAL